MRENQRTTLVIGASLDPTRYANLAIRRLVAMGYPTLLLGIDKGTIAGQEIRRSTSGLKEVDTVTMYLNPVKQAEYEAFLVETLRPRRIIFNPGAENPSLAEKAQKAGIEVVEDCTLVMLNTGQY